MTKINLSEALADVRKYYEVIKNNVCEKNGDILQEIQETRKVNGEIHMALLTIEEMLRPASPKKDTQSYDQPVRPQVKETASERIRRWSEGMGRILANIGRTYYEELTRLQTVFNDKDIVRIRQFHDDVEFHHGALQAVGKSQNQNPNVFMPLRESKLPENIRVSVLSKRDKQWGIDKFLDVLGKEIRISVACIITRDGPLWHTRRRS